MCYLLCLSCDLIGKDFGFDENGNGTTKEYKLFLEKHKDLKYRKTSAKEDNGNINDLFQEMGEILYEKNKGDLNKKGKNIKLAKHEEVKVSKCKNCIA